MEAAGNLFAPEQQLLQPIGAPPLPDMDIEQPRSHPSDGDASVSDELGRCCREDVTFRTRER
ncbi:hypothetical protein XH99_00255 [Bradyrhizobium nanningense]|uniref:Uncharacterized protein n=1 Tax=Bradyrhizobium nanningense TaxID=1325118 RepID=A0A4Q0SJR6_9BRAD|nr:hypothetical protein XH99_00255 [Bradyrhizobium nanningense]